MKTVINMCREPALRVPDWLVSLLDQSGITYEIIEHQRDYTAAETAADTQTPRLEFAKTIVVEVDGRYAMAVLPAHHRIDLDRLGLALGGTRAKLVPEPQLLTLFPDCESGAEPPFGPHYGIPVVVSAAMAMDEHITFNAGSHEVAIGMRYADFERLVHPRTVKFSEKQ